MLYSNALTPPTDKHIFTTTARTSAAHRIKQLRKLVSYHAVAETVLILVSLQAKETAEQIICLFYITSHVNYNDGGPHTIPADEREKQQQQPYVW